MRRVWHESMSNGKPCEAHHIPEDICARCKGAIEERQRIIGLVQLAHPKGHNEHPKPLCSICVLIDRIAEQS